MPSQRQRDEWSRPRLSAKIGGGRATKMLASLEANAPNAAPVFAALAQLVERLIRNE